MISDFALLTTSDDVVTVDGDDVRPMQISEESKIDKCVTATTFGHPLGLPMKQILNCNIEGVGIDYLKHSFDNFPGQSGGPIIDLNTFKVIGIGSR